MVPDLVWFALGADAYNVSHSLLGVVTLDVVVTVAIVAVWRFVVLAAARDVLPLAVGERLPDSCGVRLAQWPAVALGAACGAATHVVWDAFTHPGRWGTTHLAVLRDDLAGLPGYRWAQYVSGVLGLAVVAAYLVRRWPVQPRLPVVDQRVTPWQRGVLLAVVFGGPLIVAAVTALASRPEGVRPALVSAVSRFGVTIGVAVLLASCLWWLLPRRVRTGRVGSAVRW